MSLRTPRSGIQDAVTFAARNYSDVQCVDLLKRLFRPRGPNVGPLTVVEECTVLYGMMEEGRPGVARLGLDMLDAQGRLKEAHVHRVAASAATLEDAEEILAPHGYPFDSGVAFTLIRACRKSTDHTRANAVVQRMQGGGIPVGPRHLTALLRCFDVSPLYGNPDMDKAEAAAREAAAGAGVDAVWRDLQAGGFDLDPHVVREYIEVCYRRARKPRDRHVLAAEKAWTRLKTHLEKRKQQEGSEVEIGEGGGGGGGGGEGLPWHLWLSLMRVYAKTQDAPNARALLRFAVDESPQSRLTPRRFNTVTPLLKKEYYRAIGRLPHTHATPPDPAESDPSLAPPSPNPQEGGPCGVAGVTKKGTSAADDLVSLLEAELGAEDGRAEVDSSEAEARRA